MEFFPKNWASIALPYQSQPRDQFKDEFLSDFILLVCGGSWFKNTGNNPISKSIIEFFYPYYWEYINHYGVFQIFVSSIFEKFIPW